MSSIKERMLSFIENKGISKYKCYKDTGITRGVLDNSSGITEDNIVKFVNHYPEVDLYWLIKGDVNLNADQNKQENSTEDHPTQNSDIKDELIRLLTVDNDVKKALKFFIGKEINNFASKKLLNLIKDESFFETILSHIEDNKMNDEV